MTYIPLQPVPNQAVSVQLGEQNCQVNVYYKAGFTYLDLYVDNALIIGGVMCRDRVRIVRSAYLGFIGDLAFIDSQGGDDPVYTGFAGRFSLAYLGAGE